MGKTVDQVDVNDRTVSFGFLRIVHCILIYGTMIADNGSSKNELEMKNEPPYDKTNKMTCAPSENSDKPGIRPV